ncbi:hypothetical protein D3C76_1331800 [compost metagenome]
MAEANAEQRQAAFEMANEFDIADIRRVPWAWAQYTEVRRKCLDPLDEVRMVITFDAGFQSKLLKILADDEDKTVVGID